MSFFRSEGPRRAPQDEVGAADLGQEEKHFITVVQFDRGFSVKTTDRLYSAAYFSANVTTVLCIRYPCIS